MKKLLVCMLVLGISCAANAGLEYMVNGAKVDPAAPVAVPAGTIGLNIASEVSETGVFEGGFVQVLGAASITGATMVADNLPGSWAVYSLGNLDLGIGETDTWFMEWQTPSVDPFGAGALAVFDIDFAGPEASWNFFNLNGEQLQAITLVPEPMTMALLGLGGLFLRRRK